MNRQELPRRRWYLLVLLVVLAFWVAGDHAVLAQNAPSIADNCEPQYRKNHPDLQRAKEKKKAALRARGYPERFMKLIDREECIACVELASDVFHIMVVYKDNDYAPIDPKTGKKWTHITRNWDPGSEVIAREKTQDGSIKGFFILNTAKKSCLCCPDMDKDDTRPESFSDWDEDNGINRDHVIPFDSSNLGPLPDDLVNPGEQWVGDPLPNIEEFRKPAKKHAQALCKACAGETDKLNAAYNALDGLWDQKIEQLNAQQHQEIEHAQRDNVIGRLWYQQRSATMRSEANAKRIEELEATNARVMEEMRARVRTIEGLEARINAQQSTIAALEQAAAACAARCTTNAAETPRETTPASPVAKRPAEAPPVIAAPAPAAANPPVAPAPPAAPQRAVSPAQDQAACAQCQAWAEEVRLKTAARDRVSDALDQAEAAMLDYENQRDAVRRQIAGLAGGAGTRELEAQQQGLQSLIDQRFQTVQALREDLRRAEIELEPFARRLAECNSRCALTSGEPGEIESEKALCSACVDKEHELERAQYRLAELESEVADLERDLKGRQSAAAPTDPAQAWQEEQDRDALTKRLSRAQSELGYQPTVIADAKKALGECNRRCVPPPAETRTEITPPRVDDMPTECFGDSCASEWTECTISDSCKPVEEDCGFGGPCTDRRALTDGGPPLINLGASTPYVTSIRVEIEIRNQDKVVVPDYLGLSQPKLQYGRDWRQEATNASSSYVVMPYEPQQVRHWFNPLGLIGRTLSDYVERWRGSMGPRAIVTTRDLKAIERYSGAQAAGLPGGVHVLLTDRGGSTGKTVAMQVLNLTGKPVRLSSSPFAVQPIKQAAQRQVQQAFSRLAKVAPVRIDLNAYCVDFLKAPPGPGQILTLAPAAVQQKIQPMSRVVLSAHRVWKANALRPDSNPAAYVDSIKQWAVWTVDQKFNQKTFTDAFVGHTRKNVEAAGQKWSSQAEDMIRKASPNRWNDIAKILKGAGLPVPQ